MAKSKDWAYMSTACSGTFSSPFGYPYTACSIGVRTSWGRRDESPCVWMDRRLHRPRRMDAEPGNELRTRAAELRWRQDRAESGFSRSASPGRRGLRNVVDAVA